MNKDFNPAEYWSNAMQNNFKDKVPEITKEPDIKPADSIKNEQAKLKRQEQAKKTRDTLLAKNPNHFKELSAKSREKRV